MATALGLYRSGLASDESLTLSSPPKLTELAARFSRSCFSLCKACSHWLSWGTLKMAAACSNQAGRTKQ